MSEAQEPASPNTTEYGIVVQHTHSSEIFQFIDHAGEFAKEDKEEEGKKSLVTFLDEKSRFTSRGFDYSVVAILGPQSSGKSTLLNLLFGTKFDEMDALSGRQQTTQGVWMGVSDVDGHVILVMDVEGTDGRERGEADVFERRTSLFSLTVTSVLIINMWMNDIGRFHAANMGLLKTIFEMNLQLFKENSQELSKSKTMLLFIVRDYINTPIEKLKATLLTDLDKLWKGITKPEQYNESQVTDFFDIDFAWLPHKLLAPEQFLLDVSRLRERFINRNHGQFILKKDYDKAIPADGFGDFASGIWDVVKNNKDLKIPTQKEALALIRCEDIMNQSYAAFNKDIDGLNFQVESGQIVEDFGDQAQALLQKTLQSYDTMANRYHAETAARKRSVLVDRVVSTLHIIFDRLLERLRGRALDIFKEKANKILHESDKPASALARDFTNIAGELERSALDFFSNLVKKSVLPPEICDWGYSLPLEELHSSVSKEIDRMRKDLLNVLLTQAKDQLEVDLRVPLSRTLQQAPNNMWAAIRKQYDATLDEAIKTLKPCLESLVPEDAFKKHVDAFRAHGFGVVKKCAKDASVHLGRLMQSKFDQLFNFDANQLPRRWSRRDDIPAIFKTARGAAEALLDQYSLIRLLPEEDQIVFFVPDEKDALPQTPSGDGASSSSSSSPSPSKKRSAASTVQNIRDDDPRIILTHGECVALLDQERTATNQAFKAAIQDQEAAKAQGMSPVIIAMIVILGWNEFMTILSWILGPLLIPLIFFVAVAGYFVYAGHLGGPTGRLIQMAVRGALNQVWAQIQVLFELVQGKAGAPAAQRAAPARAKAD